jgi:serine/threonine-protein kinase HipA
MAKSKRKEIFVFADWKGLKKATLIGTLFATPSKGKEIFSFEYDQEWLDSGQAQNIDPDLQLYTGPQYLAEEKSNFGVFTDSSPDRWGKVLMRRREVAIAKEEGRIPRSLLESDYLLGVYDGHRMGALRFKTDIEGPFLDDNEKYPAPQWASLGELEHASRELEKDDIIGDPEYIKWLNMLISPGASLGGARPKASIVDNNGVLWIAKFPSRSDEKNVGAWEAVANDLAAKAGIVMSDFQLKKFSKYNTYLTRRFDRTAQQERIHFASALTLLGYNDGQDHEAGVSYLELAEFITQSGAKIKEDLFQLWKRIVFNICITNTDDHLRNHGFLLTNKGWVLSPAYDVNPIEYGTGLVLNISEDSNSLDLELAKSVIKYFRVDKNTADTTINQIKSVVSTWRDVAKKYGISQSEQEYMASAFRV